LKQVPDNADPAWHAFALTLHPILREVPANVEVFAVCPAAFSQKVAKKQTGPVAENPDIPIHPPANF
jgi:hypothetical protein